MPEKYATLLFLTIICGICTIFGGIYHEPLLIVVVVGLVMAICTVIIYMPNNKN